MNLNRAAIAVALAASSASAFSRSAFLGRNMMATSSSRSPAVAPTRSTTAMFFGNLFGGGAYGQKIEYSNLPYPGNELGASAEEGTVLTTSPGKPNLQVATFAGGCFWGLELAFQRVPGVEYTAVGYTQGPEENPNYEAVCSGATGHTEAVIVYYNPNDTSYDALLDTFFDRVNPTTVNGQGNDFGKQYRTGVYTHTPEQAAAAKERFESEQEKYRKPIATELKAATPFWPAEKYHQQYLEKGGRFGQPQDASKGATDTIRCYG